MKSSLNSRSSSSNSSGSSRKLSTVAPFNTLDDAEFTRSVHFAVWPCGDAEKMAKLLDQRPAELHARYGTAKDTLLHRACRYGFDEGFRLLVRQGAVLTARNKHGVTPLHLACQFKRVNILRQFIALKVPLDETDDNGDQAIHFAAKSGCLEAIDMLTENGIYKCVPGFRNNTIVHYAAEGGQLELLKMLVGKKCGMNMVNNLTETPLHLAAKIFMVTHNNGVDVIKLLLDSGATLSIRTKWGDTAAHYAARFSTPAILKYLIEAGIEVDKPAMNELEEASLADFFLKQNVGESEAEDFRLSLLKKTAKSGCIMKTQIVLERIMAARGKLAKNMYFSNVGKDNCQYEITQQEHAFVRMSYELRPGGCRKSLTGAKESNEVKCTGKSVTSAIPWFLKYAPDGLVKLFDLCVIKPSYAQIQGHVYFDFFLFNPRDDNESELSVINTLKACGKERFLVHPLFEIFLKLKWYKIWLAYLLYALVEFVFMISMTGYTLAHFGRVFEGQENWVYGEFNVWWFFYAVCHAVNTGFIVAKFAQICGFAKIYRAEQNKLAEDRKWVGACKIVLYMLRDVIEPILGGLILYGGFDEKVVRYLLAFCVLNNCYHFMTVISRLPTIGLYVHMLSKVMGTVLNFFASYIWHFLGYAIAFHIIMPEVKTFALFPDAFVKVIVMLLGEYEYSKNFVYDLNSGAEHEAGMAAKLLFVVFVIDMSVVLMNLVLGLAVSDIEQLQRNSAVSRLSQDACNIMFMENIFVLLERIPYFGRFLSARLLSEKTAIFQDLIYLELVDLDNSPNNRIVFESTFPTITHSYHYCPHNIIQNIIKIIKEEKRKLVVNHDEYGIEMEDRKEKLLSQLGENQEKILNYLTELEKLVKSK